MEGPADQWSKRIAAEAHCAMHWKHLPGQLSKRAAWESVYFVDDNV
jgi:hypothetical protein